MMKLNGTLSYVLIANLSIHFSARRRNHVMLHNALKEVTGTTLINVTCVRNLASIVTVEKFAQNVIQMRNSSFSMKECVMMDVLLDIHQ